MNKKVLSFIKTVADSFDESTIAYRFGGCYGFYVILKEVFPKAIAYKSGSHIVTKISNNYYDIMGLYEPDDYLEILDEDGHIECSMRHKGQTMADMLCKKEGMYRNRYGNDSDPSFLHALLFFVCGIMLGFLAVLLSLLLAN